MYFFPKTHLHFIGLEKFAAVPQIHVGYLDSGEKKKRNEKKSRKKKTEEKNWEKVGRVRKKGRPCNNEFYQKF